LKEDIDARKLTSDSTTSFMRDVVNNWRGEEQRTVLFEYE
jgi:hypothetical protein